MGDSHDIMLSKRSQTLKSAPCMTLFIKKTREQRAMAMEIRTGLALEDGGIY